MSILEALHARGYAIENAPRDGAGLMFYADEDYESTRDATIEDVAGLFGSKTLLVVLTGMGRDGLEGAKAVKAAGGRILAEAESTCTVYGMPRAVAEAGLADAVLPIDELPAVIAEEAG